MKKNNINASEKMPSAISNVRSHETDKKKCTPLTSILYPKPLRTVAHSLTLAGKLVAFHLTFASGPRERVILARGEKFTSPTPNVQQPYALAVCPMVYGREQNEMESDGKFRGISRSHGSSYFCFFLMQGEAQAVV